MKYVALLSGGKDSCFNLLHCFKNGHELVAAASLGPEPGKEELDSYMYQTVGQDAIEYVARALDVPLHRKIIKGNAVEQGSEYGGRDASQAGGVQGDETEDLYALLSTVKSHHPDIQGVSVGAILSNYQRVRVEHVCRRLFLTPLCYLWQRDQGDLLSEMIVAGLEAVLIKVAGIGLTSSHLGKNLAEMQPTLTRLNILYGSHICGEGGEFETLTLDCPLFKRRIVLSEVETVIHADNSFATVAFLRIKKAILEEKSQSHNADVRVSPLLSDAFLRVRDAVLRSQEINKFPLIPSSSGNGAEPDILYASSQKVGSWVAVAGVQRRLVNHDKNLSIEEEVRECFSVLQDHLKRHGLDFCHCANINIYLSTMDLFERVNVVYARFFGSSPAARACVAVDLQPPVRVRLDCIAYIEGSPSERVALHVQGLSYWAPANIGPYSQAVKAADRIFVSGQIGLAPSNLTLPSPRSLALEIALSFQHTERVIDALRDNCGRSWKGHDQLKLYWMVEQNDLPHVKYACETHSKDTTSPTLFLGVKALPRGSLVEKQVLLHTGLCLVPDDEGDEPAMQQELPIFEQGDLPLNTGAVHWEHTYFQHSNASCALISFIGDPLEIMDEMKALDVLGRLWNRPLSARLFFRPSHASIAMRTSQQMLNHKIPITPIPCRFISTLGADDWEYAICILGTEDCIQDSLEK